MFKSPSQIIIPPDLISRLEALRVLELGHLADLDPVPQSMSMQGLADELLRRSKLRGQCVSRAAEGSNENRKQASPYTPRPSTTAACCIAWPCSSMSKLLHMTHCPAGPTCHILPHHHGGLGLRSAAAHAPAIDFASWADSLCVIRVCEGAFCDRILQQLADPSCNLRCLASLQGAAVA